MDSSSVDSAAEVVEEVGAEALQQLAGGLHRGPVRHVDGDDRAAVHERPLVDEEVRQLVHRHELEDADRARQEVRPRAERGQVAPAVLADQEPDVRRRHAGRHEGRGRLARLRRVVDDAEHLAGGVRDHRPLRHQVIPAAASAAISSSL